MLEEQLVAMIVRSMEVSESSESDDGDNSHELLWERLSGQLIFFILFQFASFPHMILSVCDKVTRHAVGFSLLLSRRSYCLRFCLYCNFTLC